VYRTDLPVGIKVKVLREGMFIFDFSGWPPGCAIQNDKPDAFDAMAAVILQRVAVINTHLACLYTALSRRQHCALDKMIVTPSELISLKSLDDTGMSFGDLVFVLWLWHGTLALIPIVRRQYLIGVLTSGLHLLRWVQLLSLLSFWLPFFNIQLPTLYS